MKLLFAVGLGLIAGLILVGSASGLFAPEHLAPTDVAAARALDTKLDTFQRTVASARPGTVVRLTLTEQELTAKAAEFIAASDLPLRPSDVQVRLTGGAVRVAATVSLRGLATDLTVVATPTVAIGQVSLAVNEVRAAGVALPDALREQVGVQLTAAVADALRGLPLAPSQVSVGEGTLTLIGTKT